MEPAARSTPTRAFAVCAARVFDGYAWHDHAAILIERGIVRGIGRAADVPQDLPCRTLPPGALLAPGFIDLQVNGGGGVLLNDDPTPVAMRKIARAHRRYGTTACLPTFITDTRAKAMAAIAAAQSAAASTSEILGLHLEGPFISPARPGIHPPERIASPTMADLDWLGELGSAGTSLVTLAPECVPFGFVQTLAAAGIRVAAGHSQASAAIMVQAMADGLTGVTHLHNAMPAMLAREPGIVGTALSNPQLTAGLIADGLHVDPVVMRATFAAKGARGIALVTDAMPTVGVASDEFQLQGRTIKLRSGRLTSETGTLAGAHLDMATAVRNAVSLAGVSIGDALQSASLTPARFLGLQGQRGHLKAGARADIVAMTDDFHAIGTWIGGEADESTDALMRCQDE